VALLGCQQQQEAATPRAIRRHKSLRPRRRTRPSD
jgi:hypothetical protein